MSNNLDLFIEKAAGVYTIYADGRLDSSTTDFFGSFCEEKVDDNCEKVLLNFEKLEFLSSAGLRNIIMLTRKLSESNVAIYGVQPAVEDVLNVCGFAVFLKIEKTAEEALAAIS